MTAIRWTTLAALTATTALLVAAMPAAQDASRGRQSPSRQEGDQHSSAEVRVIALQHAPASEVAAIVTDVIEARIMADERTNSLVVAADANGVAQVQELVAVLDVPSKEPRHAPRETRYFDMKSRIGDSGMSLIRQLASSSRVASDGLLLAAQGPKEDLAIIEQIVAKLNAAYAASPMREDLHPRPIQANFFFIETRMDGGKPANATPLPAALQPISTTLEQNGFHNAALLAPLMVNLVESPGASEFHLEGTGGATGGIDVDLSGTLRSASDAEAVYLSVRAVLTELGMPARPVNLPDDQRLAGGLSRRKIFTIETRLEVKLGDYVILAATPSSTGDGRAIALAVRATAAE